MEGLGQIVLVVLTLAITIAQQVAKAKKKKKSNTHTVPSTVSDAEEVPFPWFVETDISKSAKSNNSEPKSYKDVVETSLVNETLSTKEDFSYDKMYSESIYSSIDVGMSTDHRTNEMQTMSIKDTKQKADYFNEVDVNRVVGDNRRMSEIAPFQPACNIESVGVESTTNGCRHDFDLLKAVVYSEILNSKYS